MASPNKILKDNFRNLLDLFFRWQRAHYHLWNIKRSLESATTTMGKTVDHLVKFHRVAEANATTQAKLVANARSWVEGSCETMECYYRNTISTVVPKIMEADQKDWEGAWRVATKRMENRYKNKFNADILDWAQKEVAPFRKASWTGPHQPPSNLRVVPSPLMLKQ